MKYPILITGANERIGFSLAEALFEDGYSIVAVYRREPGRLAELPGAHLIQADLETAEGRAKVVAEVRERYTALRGVIHNASLWLGDEPGALLRMMELHVSAPYELNMGLAELLRLYEFKADIIHVTDDSALRGSARHVGYVATKAALSNLTLSFAKLLPDVAVNSVAPGFLLAPPGSSAEYVESAKAKAVIQAQPGAEPVLQAVRFLLASRYCTGTTVVVNGGRHLK